MIMKISYFLMNKSNLDFIFDPVSELINKCETIMRKINTLKDMSSINDTVEKIY